MDITPKKRANVLVLHKNANMSVRKIATVIKISKSSVSRIIDMDKRLGHVNPNRIGKCGRKRKTTPRDEKNIIRMSIKDPKKNSYDLQKELAAAGVVVDSSTIRKRLLENGRTARRPIKKQLLTTLMMKKRLRWANKYKEWGSEEWRKVIFSDESHFEVQGHRSQFVRRSKGEALQAGHIQQSPKHPPKKMFWGYFTSDGPGRLIPIEGMMNTIKYMEVLQKSGILRLCNIEDKNWVFQQDLAPCHTSKKMQQFFRDNKITVLEWPGNSPDLNPIENLWQIIKARLRNKDCSTKIKMISAIIQVWYRDLELQNMCLNLCDSMPNRIKMLIKAKGGHISY